MPGLSRVEEVVASRFEKSVRYFAVLLIASFLAGCKAAQEQAMPASLAEELAFLRPAETKGIYHRVQRSETLWALSRRYGVGVEEIARANALGSPSRSLEIDELLFIPAAKEDRGLVADGDQPPAHRRREREKEKNESLTRPRPSLPATGPKGFIWPVRGRVAVRFGQKEEGLTSRALEIETAEGSAVVAAAAGVVTFTHEAWRGLGKVIIIDHGGRTSSLYGYLESILVSEGETVRQGERIATVGQSGRAQGPRLHFRIFQAGRSADPLKFLP